MTEAMTRRAQFERDGFLLIPGVLTQEEVQSLRSLLRPKFLQPKENHHPGDSSQFLFNVFNRYPEMQWLLAKPAANAVLKELLGPDFVVLRESSAHYQLFGAWHKDTTAQEKAGRMFQWEPDYRMVEVGYYLQDNTTVYGGGLDVEVGSHRTADPFVAPSAGPSFAQRLGQKLGITNRASMRNAYSVPSKAGDLVVFDFRINHRATPRIKEPEREADEKIAVFYACSSNTTHVDAYHNYLLSRDDYVYLRDYQTTHELQTLAASSGLNLS